MTYVHTFDAHSAADLEVTMGYARRFAGIGGVYYTMGLIMADARYVTIYGDGRIIGTDEAGRWVHA